MLCQPRCRAIIQWADGWPFLRKLALAQESVMIDMFALLVSTGMMGLVVFFAIRLNRQRE